MQDNIVMNLLKIENLSLGFNLKNGFFQALYNISLILKKGKTLAIVGESGCGKTLTGLCILNLLPKNSKITGGRIMFKEEDLLTLKQPQMRKIRGKCIALIPQDPMTSLNPLYTIENQLLEVIKEHRDLSGEEAKIVAIKALEQVKIPQAEVSLKSYPHELSGGMCQRVIIAMALACRADVIIADEPTTALDVTVQAEIMQLLNEIKTNFQTSIILITHDLALVSQNADDVAVIYAGHIVEISSSKKIFEFPRHPYTQALINSLPTLNSEKLGTIEGMPPSITDKIEGCFFHPRCKYKLSVCEQKTSELLQVNEYSKSACWLNVR